VTSQRPEPNERDEGERDRRRLEGVLPEVVKRLVDAGYEKLSEGPENVRQFVSELRLPKDALQLLLSQVDETKNGIYRAVAKEVRDFLDHTNFSEELANVLTKLSFEIKTEVRFIPNDRGTRAVPDVRSKVSVKRDRESQPPPEPAGRRTHPPEAPQNSQQTSEKDQ
jgi:hypothetical protein